MSRYKSMTQFPLPIPESYWVIPARFLTSEYPGAHNTDKTARRIDSFLEAGIDTFIDLTRPSELAPYLPVLHERAGYYGREARYFNFPIRDHDVPSHEQMTAILNRIDALLAEGHNFCVHCWGGVGRTGMVVGCYLIRHGHTPAAALAQIAEWWRDDPRRSFYPSSPETAEQTQFILNWRDAVK